MSQTMTPSARTSEYSIDRHFTGQRTAEDVVAALVKIHS